MSDPNIDLENKVQDLYMHVGALAIAFGGLMTALESEGSSIPPKVIDFLRKKKKAALADGLDALAQQIENILPKR